MDIPALIDPDTHRSRCLVHALNRAAERGLALDLGDMADISVSIRALRPAWQVAGGVPGNRYWMRVRHGDVRCRILWDDRLDCIVTVVAVRGLR